MRLLSIGLTVLVMALPLSAFAMEKDLTRTDVTSIAMLGMNKINIAVLEAAFRGE